MGKSTSQRKRLGVLYAPSTNANPIGDLEFSVDLINRIAKLSIDYGLSFKGTFSEDNGKPIALRFESTDFWCPMTITLPLTISNYGAPTEICQFI